MMRSGHAAPPLGYERDRVGAAEIVALSSVLPAVREAVREGSLYQYAATRPERVFHGRAPAYVVPLPGGGPTVVVRHSSHGGLLAPLTRDRFIGATRAPRELEMSVRLAAMGIPTPTLAAYVIYRAGPLVRRSDVATMLIDHGSDLAGLLGASAEAAGRAAAVNAASALLVAMARGGVQHADLNLKNILIAAHGSYPPRAYLLDVDRVSIQASRARAAAANAARLVRSARKWRDRRGAPITDAEVATLEAAALGRAP